MDHLWQSKMSTLGGRAEMLFKSQDLCDCEFLVGPNKVKIQSHKLLLAISSPVFHAMFYGDMAEKKSVEIIDILPDAFRRMLQHIYTDRVYFESCSQACEVYITAIKYMLPFLEQYCINYLKKNVTADSACELFEFAKFHDNSCTLALQDVCLKIFQNSTKEVLKSPGFVEADYSTVLTLFKQQVLDIDSELELFQGIKKWTDAEAARTGETVESFSSVSEAISHIRFLRMTAEEFTDGPAMSWMLTPEEKLSITMNITSPGVTEIPSRINRITADRTTVEAVVDTNYPAEWSLVRSLMDTIVYPVTRWGNPFSKKGFSVSRSIRLKGVKIGSQRRLNSDECSIVYKENMTVVLKKDWSVKFSGSKFVDDTIYNSMFTVLFFRPVLLEAGKKYWIIVQFDKNGDYQFFRDINRIYEMYNNKIQLYEGFSPIIEFLFCDKPEEQN